MTIDLKTKKILVTGGTGFVGSFVIEKLLQRDVPRDNISVPRSANFDLRKRENCERAVQGQDIVIHLAANVGGIGYNQKKPGELFYDNLSMSLHLMEEARRARVEKFVAIGSICSYPKFAPMPFKEEDLWKGYPEETNASYGLAKLMALVQAQAYHQQYGFRAINLLMVNLYGPRDKFDLATGHVIPSLIRKIHEAEQAGRGFIEAWGTGNATREFLYVEDAAEGIALATERYAEPEPVNLGSGIEISIRDLVATIGRLMGFRGEIRWDTSQPDGQPRRRLDVSKAEGAFGFKATTSLEEGLKKTIRWWSTEASKTHA